MKFELRNVTKKFKKTAALDDVSLSVSGKSIIGLVGKNGSGKTTLLRHVSGLYLPTSGECETFGVRTEQLGAGELGRIGAVQQDDTFLAWMQVRQLLGYISHFYERWDNDLERRLLDALELDEKQRVGTLSPGNRQKLALIVASCHHPELLLLDEPLSALDPIARQTVLVRLLDQFRSDDVAIVISSHMIPELERIADRIVLLDRGRLVVDEDLDSLKEKYAEWVVTGAGSLPAIFTEPYVIVAEREGQRARVFVSDAGKAGEFSSRYNVTVEAKAVNLERIFGLVTRRSNGTSEAVEEAWTVSRSVL